MLQHVLRKRCLFILALLIGLLAVACQHAPNNQGLNIEATVAAAVQAAFPTPTPTPTPNIPLTVEAQVQERLDTIPTPEPTLTPTPTEVIGAHGPINAEIGSPVC